MAAVEQRFAGAVPWGPADLLGRLSQRHDSLRARAEADLRRFALDRARPRGLARMMTRHLPGGTAYFNVGHANLSDMVFDAVRAIPGTQITVMIHDTIPLDYPQFCALGVPRSFAEKLRRTGARADLILCVSEQTRADVHRHLAPSGHVPPTLVAPLGIELVSADPTAIPRGLIPDRPYFVSLGTIEPRKNHALLLDVWDAMQAALPAEEVPDLLILGRRGWNNDAVFRRLDALRGPRRVHEAADLPDEAITALLEGSTALLFPSFAEGFGLPPVEAAARGVPVICGDLAIYREVLGNYPVYADVNDRYLWQRTISAMAKEARATGNTRKDRIAPPGWDGHFKHVLGKC